MKKLIILIVLLFTFSVTAINAHDTNNGKKYKQNRRNNNSGYDHRWKGYHKRHHRNQNPQYRYRGHWNSWHEWENHYNKNRHRYRDGRYNYNHHQEVMMFRICESGSCFSFSIKK